MTGLRDMRDDTVYSGRQASRKGLRRLTGAQGLCHGVAHGVLPECSGLKIDANAMRELSMFGCRANGLADTARNFSVQDNFPTQRSCLYAETTAFIQGFFFEMESRLQARSIGIAATTAIRRMPLCLDLTW